MKTLRHCISFATVVTVVATAFSGVVVNSPAIAQSRLDSRGLPIGTDAGGNAARGAYNPYVSGPASSPWTQSTNGGTQQVPAPIPPPVTYGGAAAPPGAPAKNIYGGGGILPRESLGPESYGSGPTPGRRAFAQCIDDWSKDSGMTKSQWRAACVRRFYPKDDTASRR